MWRDTNLTSFVFGLYSYGSLQPRVQAYVWFTGPFSLTCYQRAVLRFRSFYLDG